MSIDKEKLKNMLEKETRVWLKAVVGMSMNFCGDFDAFVLSLEKTARKRQTKILYGSSSEWRIVYKFLENDYFILDLKNNKK